MKRCLSFLFICCALLFIGCNKNKEIASKVTSNDTLKVEDKTEINNNVDITSKEMKDNNLGVEGIKKPIDIKGSIKDKYGEFTFTLIYSDNSKCNLTKINITDKNGKLFQTISDNVLKPKKDTEYSYNFELVDMNFDGYKDISIDTCRGGSNGANPRLFFLWNKKHSEFIYNKKLSDMSQEGPFWCDEKEQCLYLSIMSESSKPMLIQCTYFDGQLMEYYQYTGGKLPEDLITPIDYIYKKKINKKLREFKFEIYGQKIHSFDTTMDDKWYYLKEGDNKIKKIVISCDELYYSQELIFAKTNTPDISTMTYGFSLDDWNFDGYLDIGLWKHEGGTLLNVPTYYWLWDNKNLKYIKCKELEDISEDTFMDIDLKNHQIVANSRYSDGYYEGYYQWYSGHITLVKTHEVRCVYYNNKTGKSKVHNVIKKLLKGKWKVTDDYYNYYEQ